MAPMRLAAKQWLVRISVKGFGCSGRRVPALPRAHRHSYRDHTEQPWRPSWLVRPCAGWPTALQRRPLGAIPIEPSPLPPLPPLCTRQPFLWTKPPRYCCSPQLRLKQTIEPRFTAASCVASHAAVLKSLLAMSCITRYFRFSCGSNGRAYMPGKLTCSRGGLLCLMFCV